MSDGERKHLLTDFRRPVRVGDRIAVYGEYLSTFDQVHGAMEMRGKVRLEGACWLQGVLYKLGNTAGFVPERKGQVVGELYEILDPSAIAWVDRQIEDDCARSDYTFERKLVHVIEPETEAWAYVWGPDEIRNGRAIPTGDWRGHTGNLR